MVEIQQVRKYDVRNPWPTPHIDQVLKIWSRVHSLAKSGVVCADGKSLDVAAVVAIARYGCTLSLGEDLKAYARLDDSVKVLHDYLSNGYYLYGVNTGYGGSADTRTTDLPGLQRALMQLTQSAILTKEDLSNSPSVHEYLGSHSMPSAWVRATMLIRCNANIRGHSGTLGKTLDTIVQLLNRNIIPIIPLRGSLSASGDLMPLAYLTGAIQGSPDIFTRVGDETGKSKVMSAEQALKHANIEPIVLGPKEGLSLINGSAAAAAVATLGLFEAHQLAVVSQLLTAMGSEALYGNAEWAHPFIASVRPHSGQIEAAQNIRTFLRGSRLVYGLEQTKNRFKSGLAQERYAWRSSPQWLAPQLEDLAYADRQLTVELNSTSDNPVINVADNDIHCGANFQAASVTSATEKIRLALQSIGKMMFSQTSEMINNDLNNGLPPNLAADDPSLSFCLKGLDINTAAYMSELSFLANPVSNHVQAAEMHNQSINSLGLLSSRQTFAAIECLSMIAANTLYTACQGVDLRTLHRTFLEQLQAPAQNLIESLADFSEVRWKFFDLFWMLFEKSWYEGAALDATERAEKAAETLATAIIAFPDASNDLGVVDMSNAHRALSQLVLETYVKHREAFFENPTTPEYLGQGTKRMYLFVRETLGVPLHRGLVEHPIAGDAAGNNINSRPKKTIGSWVSIVYEAIRNGQLYNELLSYLEAEGVHAWSNGVNGHA